MVGRFPSNTRWGTSHSGVPSARTSSAVFPNASASACAKHVRDEQVVVPAERVERLREGDEVARDEPGALVDELVEGVLAVGARLAPVDRARCRSRPAARPASTRFPLLSIVSCWR